MKFLTLLLTIFLISISPSRSQIWEIPEGPYEDETVIKKMFMLSNDLFINHITGDKTKYYYLDSSWVNTKRSILSDSSIILEDIIENGENVLLSTRHSGLFFSENGGNNFDSIGKIFGNQYLINLNYGDSKLFGQLSGRNSLLLSSEDYGRNWDTINYKIEDTIHTIYSHDIAISGRNIYALQEQKRHPIFLNDILEGGLYISQDEGITWSKKLIDSNFISVFAKDSIVGVSTAYNNIIISTNYGESWQLIQELPAIVRDFNTIGNRIIGLTNEGILVLDENSLHWDYIINNELTGKVKEQLILFEDEFYFLTERFGVYKTDKDFKNTSRVRLSTIGEYDNIVLDNDTLFATSGKRGIQYSTDMGHNWHIYSEYLDKNDYQVFNLIKSGKDLIVKLPDLAVRYMISRDYGNTWTEYSLSPIHYPMELNEAIKSFKSIGDTIIFNTRYGLMYTTFESDTLLERDNNLVEIDPNSITYFEVINENELIAFTYENGVYKSNDNGQFWEKLSDNLSGESEYVIDFAIQDNNYYALTELSKVYKSSNFGKTWQKELYFSEYGQYEIYDFEVVNGNFIATGKPGVLVSENEGEVWKKRNSGLLNINEEQIYADLHIFENNVFINGFRQGTFKTTLDKLGLISSIGTETGNYLNIDPPYPLPAKSEVRLNFQWDSQVPMEVDDISVYNIDGTIVNTNGRLRIDKQEAHYGQLIWNCSNINSGIYLIKVNHGTEQKTQKVIVNR